MSWANVPRISPASLPITVTVAATAWSVVYSLGVAGVILLSFRMIVVDYIMSGVVVASILWCVLRPLATILWLIITGRLVGNKLLLSPPSHSTPADSAVEWAYAFDVHTNAFFPLYLTLYLAQLFFLPVVLKDRWVCLWVGNTLYLAA